MSILLRVFAALALGLSATTAWTAAATFQIETIYSNADGTVQYVVLHETAGLNGQQALSGGGLAVNHAGFTKVFTFLNDLPSSATANRRVLIASQGLPALGIIVPDYVFPDRFLATDGATLSLVGVVQVTYASLPIDGVRGIDRTGMPIPNVATNFAGASAVIPPLPVTVIEYYDAARDHYFVTALQSEIDALDLQRFPGWTRTGQSFGAYATLESGGPGAEPVCRFYIPPENGDSHFLSASMAECAALLQLKQFNPLYSGYIYETPSAFFIALPNLSSGACPLATIPVYRLWNQRADSNHRYTTDAATKAALVARGYVPEGYGTDAVAMCAPSTLPVDLSSVSLNGIVWTGTLFVAVAGGPNGVGLILTSRDGAQWSVRSSGTPTLRGITWSGSELVAVGAGGAIVTSPDGYRWTAQASFVTGSLNAVASSDTQFMAVGDGGALLVSPDGIAWTSRVSKTTENLNAVAWSGTKFVFVGDDGTILTALTTGLPTLRVSGTAAKLAAIAAASNGKVTVVGANGTILTSSDGNTWTPRTSGTNASLEGVTAADIAFIAVGTGGRILTSANGNNWGVVQSKTAIDLGSVAWSGTLFVAVGAAGTIVTSPDGVVWTVH